MRRIVLALASFFVLAPAAQAVAADHTAPVPSEMLGNWAHGSCSAASNRLLITPTKAKLGVAQSAPIQYFPNDEGAGRGAIHWAQEYVVDNFVYDSTSKAVVHNTQGFGMPGQVVYKRCP
jgi:hypothetical protein